jgi:hypothetical protein
MKKSKMEKRLEAARKNKSKIEIKLEVSKLKGAKDGLCNRSSCLAPGADWYNHSTRKFYCHRCAIDLNHYNRRDAMELWGHELCTKD